MNKFIGFMVFCFVATCMVSTSNASENTVLKAKDSKVGQVVLLGNRCCDAYAPRCYINGWFPIGGFCECPLLGIGVVC